MNSFPFKKKLNFKWSLFKNTYYSFITLNTAMFDCLPLEIFITILKFLKICELIRIRRVDRIFLDACDICIIPKLKVYINFGTYYTKDNPLILKSFDGITATYISKRNPILFDDICRHNNLTLHVSMRDVSIKRIQIPLSDCEISENSYNFKVKCKDSYHVLEIETDDYEDGYISDTLDRYECGVLLHPNPYDYGSDSTEDTTDESHEYYDLEIEDISIKFTKDELVKLYKYKSQCDCIYESTIKELEIGYDIFNPPSKVIRKWIEKGKKEPIEYIVSDLKLILGRRDEMKLKLLQLNNITNLNFIDKSGHIYKSYQKEIYKNYLKGYYSSDYAIKRMVRIQKDEEHSKLRYEISKLQDEEKKVKNWVNDRKRKRSD